MAEFIGSLQDCTTLMDRPSERDAFWEEHGYLFVRDVLSVAHAENLREQIAGEMKSQGAIEEDARSDAFMLSSRDAVDQAALYEHVDYGPFWQAALPLFRTLLGEQDIYVFRNSEIRFAVPNERFYTTPPHQDGASVPGAFRTAWAPLMDVPRPLGGIVLADGSHKRGLRPIVSDANLRSYSAKIPFGFIPLETIEEPWLGADFKIGDVLIMHPWTIHRALPNHSDRVRLSVDTRFARAADRHDYVSHSERGCDFVKHKERFIAEMPIYGLNGQTAAV